jgi:MFS superfamily sulfate permease-like transporter
MADLGESSTANSSAAAGGPGHKRSSWVVVGLITTASIILGFAFVLRSIPLAIVGGVLLLAGVVLGFTSGIMEDVH